MQLNSATLYIEQLLLLQKQLDILTIPGNKCLELLFDRNVRHCYRWSCHGTVLLLWAWSTFIDNHRVYGLLLAIYVTCFFAFSAKVEYG